MQMRKHDKLLREIRDRLVRKYKPEKVVLFGSRASGSPRRDSDYDLFIIKRTHKRPIDRTRDVSRIFFDRHFGMDIIVRTPSEVKRRIAMGDFFIQEILRKGRVLYEK